MKDKALRFLSAIVVALVMTMLTACEANETEKALDGKWESTGYVLQEDGVKGKMILNFDAEDFNGKMTISFTAFEMDEIMEIKMKFRWSADEKAISMDYYGDPEIEFNTVINLVASAMGLNTDQLKRQLENELLSEIRDELDDAEFRIISLTDSKLIVEDTDLGKVTFKRIGGRRHSGSKRSRAEETTVAEAVPELADDEAYEVDEVVEEAAEIPEFDYDWFDSPFTYDGVIYRPSSNAGNYSASSTEEDVYGFGIYYKLIPDNGAPEVMFVRYGGPWLWYDYIGRDDQGMLMYGMEYEGGDCEVIYVREDGRGRLQSGKIKRGWMHKGSSELTDIHNFNLKAD